MNDYYPVMVEENMHSGIDISIEFPKGTQFSKIDEESKEVSTHKARTFSKLNTLVQKKTTFRVPQLNEDSSINERDNDS